MSSNALDLFSTASMYDTALLEWVAKQLDITSTTATPAENLEVTQI
jgi:hypothetical protein